MLKRIALISFSFLSILFAIPFGFLSEALNRDDYLFEINEIQEEEIKTVILRSNNVMRPSFYNWYMTPGIIPFFYPSFFTYLYNLPTYYNLESQQTSYLESFQSEEIENFFAPYVNKEYYNIDFFNEECVLNSPYSDGHFVYKNAKGVFSNSFIEVDSLPTFCEVDNRLTDPSISRLPNNYNEIAITDFQADLLLHYGLVNPMRTFDSIDDIIGQHYGGYTITGIYKICDYQKEINLRQGEIISTGYAPYLFLHCLVKAGFAKERIVDRLSLMRLGYAISTNYDLSSFKVLFEKCRNLHNPGGGEYNIKLVSPVSYKYRNLYNSYANDLFSSLQIALWIGVIILPIAIILTIIFYGFDDKKKNRNFSLSKEMKYLFINSGLCFIGSFTLSILMLLFVTLCTSYLAIIGIGFMFRAVIVMLILQMVAFSILLIALIFKILLKNLRYNRNRENNKE